MVCLSDPYVEELKEKLLILKENSGKLKEIESEGIISKRFRKYCEQLLMLDYLSEEAEAFAEIRDSRLETSLLDMKFMLDSIAFSYVVGAFEKPLLYDNYKELHSLAQERYDNTIAKVSGMLEGVV